MTQTRATLTLVMMGVAMGLAGCSAFRTSEHASAPVTPAQEAALPANDAGDQAFANRWAPTDPALDQATTFRPTTEMAGAPAQPATINIARVTFAEEGSDFDPAVSRDGTMLVYASTQHRDKSDIYVKRVDSRVVTRLTNDPAQDVMPTISPDGSMIAFASDRTGNWDIFVMPIAGGKAVQVTDSPEQEIAPSWSPDGTRIAYSRLGQASSRWEMWVCKVAKPDVASFLGYGLFPKWNPVAGKGENGTDRLCYQLGKERGRRGFSVWTVDVGAGDQAGNPAEIIGSASDALINPTWSADGNWIVYAQVPLDATDGAGWLRRDGSVSPAQASLWMISAEGDGNMRLTTGQGLALTPAWSRDNRLYFVSDRNGVDNVWSMDVGQAMQTAMALISPAKSAAPTVAQSPQPAPAMKPAAHDVVAQDATHDTPLEEQGEVATVPEGEPEHE